MVRLDWNCVFQRATPRLEQENQSKKQQNELRPILGSDSFDVSRTNVTEPFGTFLVLRELQPRNKTVFRLEHASLSCMNANRCNKYNLCNS